MTTRLQRKKRRAMQRLLALPELPLGRKDGIKHMRAFYRVYKLATPRQRQEMLMFSYTEPKTGDFYTFYLEPRFYWHSWLTGYHYFDIRIVSRPSIPGEPDPADGTPEYVILKAGPTSLVVAKNMAAFYAVCTSQAIRTGVAPKDVHGAKPDWFFGAEGDAANHSFPS